MQFQLANSGPEPASQSASSSSNTGSVPSVVPGTVLLQAGRDPITTLASKQPEEIKMFGPAQGGVDNPEINFNLPAPRFGRTALPTTVPTINTKTGTPQDPWSGMMTMLGKISQKHRNSKRSCYQHRGILGR